MAPSQIDIFDITKNYDALHILCSHLVVRKCKHITIWWKKYRCTVRRRRIVEENACPHRIFFLMYYLELTVSLTIN